MNSTERFNQKLLSQNQALRQQIARSLQWKNGPEVDYNIPQLQMTSFQDTEMNATLICPDFYAKIADVNLPGPSGQDVKPLCQSDPLSLHAPNCLQLLHCICKIRQKVSHSESKSQSLIRPY